jgi:hypothetical protein
VSAWAGIDERDDHYLGLAGTNVVATEALLVLRDNLAEVLTARLLPGHPPRRHPYESRAPHPPLPEPDERPGQSLGPLRIELYDGRAPASERM